MEVTCSYLFVYGTLLVSGNKYAVYLQNHCRLMNEGRVKGRLYDIGEYPGAVIDESIEYYIYGSIYSMDDAEAVLKIIDEYEGLGSDEPRPHEYNRSLVGIENDNGIIACWMYLYNLPVDALAEVPGGRYLDYINRNI